MSDDFEKFTAPRPDEEIHQGVEAQVVMGTSPEDGLPVQTTRQNFDVLPVLCEETLICMADKRSFVVRDERTGEVVKTFPPSVVTRLPNGVYVVPLPPSKGEASDIARRALQRSLQRLGWKSRLPLEHLVVEPIRPQCKHYLRQQTDLAASRENRYYARACMAQKSEDGEYYSVRDTLIGACDIREPRHLESEIAVLDKFDGEMMLEAKKRREMEDFDVDKELAEEVRKGSLGVLG